MGEIITHFEIDEEKLAILKQCMENYGVGSDDANWSQNIISREAIVYQNGAIARTNSSVNHSVDSTELSLCKSLAVEAESIMSGIEVGMGSESSDMFHQFFIAANTNEAIPSKIDESLIRAKFGGTIFPLATITVEPLSESGIWWSEVEYDGSESASPYFQPWKSMIAWFNNRPEFIDTAFIRIGDRNELIRLRLQRNIFPGCVLPRLVLGLTRNGSLVGLFGFSVHT
jgi:hypothetical protein